MSTPFARALAACTCAQLVLLSGVLGAAAATEPPPTSAPPAWPLPATDTPPASDAPQRPLTPMGQAIETWIQREAAELETLEAELAVAADSDVALEVQRRIEALKVQTELGILRTQCDFARAAGRVADAAAIEAAIAAAVEARKRPADIDPAQRRPAGVDSRERP